MKHLPPNFHHGLKVNMLIQPANNTDEHQLPENIAVQIACYFS